MKYVIGKSYEDAVEQSKEIAPFDYPIPTEKENQRFLNLLFSDSQDKFVQEREERLQQRRETHEKNPI